MENLDTVSLECLIAVAETNSFTKASEKVKRTQSAVSQQINKLEHLLARPLFVRGKNLCLTAEGEIFYGYAKQIIGLQKQALNSFKTPVEQKQVRFGLPEDFAYLFLDAILPEFLRIHPNITLNIDCDLTLNLLDRFKKNEYDLVLLKIAQPEDTPYAEEVFCEKLKWVGNKNIIHRLQTGHPIPLVLSPDPCIYRSKALKALEEKSMKWKIIFCSSSYTSKVSAVKAGFGITVMPKSMIHNDLKILEDPYLPYLDDMHVSLLKNKSIDSAVLTFEKFILEKFRTL